MMDKPNGNWTETEIRRRLDQEKAVDTTLENLLIEIELLALLVEYVSGKHWVSSAGANIAFNPL